MLALIELVAVTKKARYWG